MVSLCGGLRVAFSDGSLGLKRPPKNARQLITSLFEIEVEGFKFT